MTHIVAISPHLDDAVFSIGGLLAAHARAGDRITIMTCFTANVAVPTGFALACQLDKGLGAEVDYMALRRAEDRNACAMIGATAIHLPLLEAPHRGYGSAPELFGERRTDDGMLAPLTALLAERIATLAPDRVLGPLAIGDHVDHWLVRHAIGGLKMPVLLWEDWPYLTRRDRQRGDTPTIVHHLTRDDHVARTAMCAAYASQIGFQFGSHEALETASDAVKHEKLYRYPSQATSPT